MSYDLLSLTTKDLRRAADLKDKIAKLTKELKAILGTSAPVAAKTTKQRRKMSAASRAKMAAAQKARWAKVKATKKK